MANTQYEYVKKFEQRHILHPNTWIVIKVDGNGFRKLTDKYGFEKPNDRRGLDLMNKTAEVVFETIPDISLAYAHSDEYTFVFPPDCELYDRRASKLESTVVSMFSMAYGLNWSSYFPDRPLSHPLPSFDGKIYTFPSLKHLRDYLSWRQVDCHINNLFNTTFWTLVKQGGMGRAAAEQYLSGTVSADKHAILFERFGINYNEEPEMMRRGTLMYRDFAVRQRDSRTLDDGNGDQAEASGVPDLNVLGSTKSSTAQAQSSPRPRPCIGVTHQDIVGAKGDNFWLDHPWLLEHSNAARKKAAQRFFGAKGSEDITSDTTLKQEEEG